LVAAFTFVIDLPSKNCCEKDVMSTSRGQVRKLSGESQENTKKTRHFSRFSDIQGKKRSEKRRPRACAPTRRGK
jgi:hypothetical protein